MADFHKAFEAIDEDGSGEITIDELQHYMIKNNYKESFVSKWLTLFDENKSGKITYKHYCETLGLVPGERKMSIKALTKEIEEQMIKPVISSTENVSGKNEDKDKQLQIKKSSQSSSIKSKKVSKNRKISYCNHKRSLRSSIKPGVILILLSGVHRGKRVIFLKQLDSGLLLVTGPLKLNGCPLRRVHQKMVIATKTILDIDNVNIADHLSDDYFAHSEKSKNKKDNADVNNIFAKTKKQYNLNDKRKEDQKVMDTQIINAIKKRSDKKILANYLKSLFTLSNKDYPHKMQF